MTYNTPIITKGYLNNCFYVIPVILLKTIFYFDIIPQ